MYDGKGAPRYGREYTMEEALQLIGVSRHTYKKWEKTRLVPPVARHPQSGYRYFTDADIERLKKFVEQRKKDPKSRLGINKVIGEHNNEI